MRKGYYLLLLLLCGMASCLHKPVSTSFFSSVDSLLESKPDSAYSLLESVSDIESMPTSQQAEYALLLTQAMDKNMIPYVNDSIIKVAVDYYKRSEDLHKRANAFYYQGRVYQDLGDDVAAVEAFLAALDVVGEHDESKFSLLVNANLGNCYASQGLYVRAMERARKAYSIGLKVGEKKDYAFLLRDIGNAYLFLNNPDSALNYYHQALSISYEAKDSLWSSTFLLDIAHFYNDRSEFEEANNYVSRSIELSPQDQDLSFHYQLKGTVLGHLQLNDSASYYLHLSIEGSSLYFNAATNYALYTLARTTKDYESAVDYVDNYIVLADSIQTLYQRSEITKLMNNYALESHKKEVTVKQQRFMLYLVIAFLALFTISVYVFFLFDRRKKQKLIGLQGELMQNRSKMLQLQNVLATSTSEIEQVRHENEAARIQLQERQKELCMRLFQTKSSYKYVQDFELCRKQKKLPKEISEQERTKIQQAIEEIYVDFVQQYQHQYPQLSEGDLYCCTLVYMGFANPLIAYLMGVDANVITQRRYRIKGKLDENGFAMIFGSSLGAK